MELLKPANRSSGEWRGHCWLLVLVSLLFPAGIWAGEGATEYEVKAAFLYKFASFVEWPSANAKGPVCIGVLGQDPFGAILDEVVNGKSVNGRPFSVRRFKRAEELPACEIVFISSSEKKKLRQIFAAIDLAAVLTVGDTPGFCESGGVVNLEVEDSKVHLRVNLDAVEKAHLQFSSKLINLATLVRPRNQ